MTIITATRHRDRIADYDCCLCDHEPTVNTPADTGDRPEVGSGATAPQDLAVACPPAIPLLERLAIFVGSRPGTSAHPVDDILSLLADSLEAGAVALARIMMEPCCDPTPE